MTLPGLVLIHGGLHAADCWDPVVAELATAVPELRTLAVDLPGRRSRPADLRNAGLADWADSVVADVDAAQLTDVVVVGHSIGGLVVPRVVARLGTERVREVVLIAAVIPPPGRTAVDRLPAPLVRFTRLTARRGVPILMPRAIARLTLCNGMTRQQRSMTLSRMYPEASKVLIESVGNDLPNEVPRTWILTLRDRMLSTRRQREGITALGGVHTMICVDSCHDVMLSDPKGLAAILLRRCEIQARA